MTRAILIKIFIPVGFFCAALASWAQNISGSPYSSFGLGELESKGTAFNAGMGDAKYALLNRSLVNVANPASYARLAGPTFDVNIAGEFIKATTDSTQTSNNIYARNFTFGFPILKKNKKNILGVSFGLLPFSRVGYQLRDSVLIDTFSVDVQYLGTGGLNQFYLGSGISILNTLRDSSGLQLGVGFNASYIFGVINRTRRILPDPSFNAFNIRTNSTTRINDFQFDAGLFYLHRINQSLDITLGAAYSLGKPMRAYHDQLALTYTGPSDFEVIKDTITSTVDTGSIFLPQAIGLGMSVHINGRLLLEVDYSFQDWDQYKFFGQKVGLANRKQYSFGLQYLPQTEADKRFWKMTYYRLGFRYLDTHLNVDGKQLNEIGISFGAGVPLSLKHRYSMFNLGIVLGQRGENVGVLIREQFMYLNIGFTFTPHKNFPWFVKRKYN